jgi:hypothetical protein
MGNIEIEEKKKLYMYTNKPLRLEDPRREKKTQ